jgi:hypothetical protein
MRSDARRGWRAQFAAERPFGPIRHARRRRGFPAPVALVGAETPSVTSRRCIAPAAGLCER